jgi:acyl-CoA thioesterase
MGAMLARANLLPVGAVFTETTQVERVDAGRYGATVDEGWNLRPLPQGGIVTALALRAMTDELDTGQRLRTLHTTFAAQVSSGPVDIEVELLRRGRSMSQARAEVRNPGADRGHLTTAVFGSTREGFEFTDLVRPDVPPPEDCPSFRDPPPPGVQRWDPLPFWSRVEGRPAIGIPPWDTETPRTTSMNAVWHRFDEPPMLDDGTLDPLAVVTLADVMPGAVGQRIGQQERMWFGPSVDLTVHVLAEARTEWLLFVNRARHAGDGYASVDAELWSGDHLVAYATQVMFFTFLD